MAALPTHETLPADHKAAIRQMKQALRAQIGDVQAVFDKLSARISERLQEIETLKAAGQEVWPTVPFRDIAEGTVSDEQRAAIKRRGCAVIKGHFPREQALAWDTAMLEYLDRNHFDDVLQRAWRQLLRFAGGFAPGDLPDLLVALANAGAAER
ncbi:Protein of uncharacterised function (DUF1479) [Klebsiella pneumoniae subsp. ozaenae]|uniref:Protein of uncharacterized function (DUF1479) n=1 Tax=Klebsiella pneumoniae subsp. ozaenae TaxID=574 RepID=A0A378BQM5_KLEPO|nr:Protein of uncharacterised function (DUF1479) [Klebsiella pneumoniae subsp. ozaenae]